jgi:hypothetical protein
VWRCSRTGFTGGQQSYRRAAPPADTYNRYNRYTE